MFIALISLCIHKKSSKFSPGHKFWLHNCVSVGDPRRLQSSPPAEGGGLSHRRFLVCVPEFDPSLQVLEHGVHVSQSE